MNRRTVLEHCGVHAGCPTLHPASVVRPSEALGRSRCAGGVMGTEQAASPDLGYNGSRGARVVISGTTHRQESPAESSYKSIVIGSSMYVLNSLSQLAATAPSITRWSQLMVADMNEPSSYVPGALPGMTRFSDPPTARMHACDVDNRRQQPQSAQWDLLSWRTESTLADVFLIYLGDRGRETLSLVWESLGNNRALPLKTNLFNLAENFGDGSFSSVTCGGLTMAQKLLVPYMPRLEMVNVPPV